LTLEDLEKQITDTEIAIADAQQQFADAATFKEGSRGKQLHEDYDELSKKLARLEEEYFRREH